VSALTLKHISKRFGDVVALSQVNLDVEDGEFCVLLGPSGCGKSTLLQIVAGLTPQDEGSVLMDGHSVDGLSPRQRDVAMVFQSYALYPQESQNPLYTIRSWKPPGSSALGNFLTANRGSSREANANGWPWEGRLCAALKCFFLMSL